jgi:ParB-like chromosome segregation protein Spo0J
LDLYRAAWVDPDIRELAESIRKNGLLEPLIITLDKYIVSGHQRYAALRLIDQVWVDCRVLPLRRDSMPADDYIGASARA